MDIVNLTPHPIAIADEAGVIVRTIIPSGQVARVMTDQKVVARVDGIEVVETTFGAVHNLPSEEEGTIYIVSSLVAQAVSGRGDVVSPDTGPTCVRDASGRIVAVRRFQRW